MARFTGAGGSLFSALLQALTQAAGMQPSSKTGSTGTATQAGSSSDPTSVGALAQDLHAFLHDLFGALRQASQQGSATAATVTTAAAVTTAPTGSASGTASASGQSGTAALQSFLTNLLQDLQNGSTGTPATLGGTINTTA